MHIASFPLILRRYHHIRIYEGKFLFCISIYQIIYHSIENSENSNSSSSSSNSSSSSSSISNDFFFMCSEPIGCEELGEILIN